MALSPVRAASPDDVICRIIRSGGWPRRDRRRIGAVAGARRSSISPVGSMGRVSGAGRCPGWLGHSLSVRRFRSTLVRYGVATQTGYSAEQSASVSQVSLHIPPLYPAPHTLEPSGRFAQNVQLSGQVAAHVAQVPSLHAGVAPVPQVQVSVPPHRPAWVHTRCPGWRTSGSKIRHGTFRRRTSRHPVRLRTCGVAPSFCRPCTGRIRPCSGSCPHRLRLRRAPALRPGPGLSGGWRIGQSGERDDRTGLRPTSCSRSVSGRPPRAWSTGLEASMRKITPFW